MSLPQTVSDTIKTITNVWMIMTMSIFQIAIPMITRSGISLYMEDLGIPCCKANRRESVLIVEEMQDIMTMTT